nr:hypothetical protein CFP56_61202 [Quercus suber]
MVETKFGSKAMQLFTFLQYLRACTCLEKRREVCGHGPDELGEDSNVILEVGFDGKGLDLLELSERSAMGLERQRRRERLCRERLVKFAWYSRPCNYCLLVVTKGTLSTKPTWSLDILLDSIYGARELFILWQGHYKLRTKEVSQLRCGCRRSQLRHFFRFFICEVHCGASEFGGTHFAQVSVECGILGTRIPIKKTWEGYHRMPHKDSSFDSFLGL